MVTDVASARPRASALGVAVALLLVALVAPVAPARADYVALCTGYAGCRDAGYPNAGYQAANEASYWRMYTGHNCTNYVAYRLVESGLPNTRPWSGGGNAENWGLEMSSITDQTPMVGSVAWWAENVRPAGSSGHVAYVERVVSSTEIWISEDSWGGDFHWRRVTRSGSGWPSGFIHFNDLALRSKAAPTSSGSAQVGQTLTATAGTWSPAATSYTYQWLADSQPVAGATSSTFALGPGKIGKRISVQVTASGTGYAPAIATSAASPPVAPGDLTVAETPLITGDPLVGSALTASRGTWSPSPRSRAVQWLSDGEPIDGATDWSLELGPDQAGTVVSAVVTATRNGYEPSTATSPATEAVLGGEVSLTTPFVISGVPRLGAELRVVDGSFEPATADVTHTWLRDGVEITGASGPSYVLGASDVGTRISVRVDVTKQGYKPATQTTGETPAVRTVPELRVVTRGGPLRAEVAIAVLAPGVAVPTGKVSVRIGSLTRTVSLREGQRTVLLLHLPAGTRKVVVRYLGRGLVEAGVFRGQVRILKH